jgi:death-on-curing protein
MKVYLTAEEVIEIHTYLLELWGGEEGSGHRGAEDEGAEAAVQAVKNSYYLSNIELAAAYAVYIVQGHVFMDGNKRTAAAAATTFLEYNRETWKSSEEELAKIMLLLQQRAEQGERTDDLVQWLAEIL